MKQRTRVLLGITATLLVAFLVWRGPSLYRLYKDWPVMIPVGGRTSYAGDVLAIVVADTKQQALKAQIETLQFPQWLEQVFKNKQFDMTIISHTEPLDINIYADPNYYFQYGKP